MTANELADELTKMFRGEEYDRLIHEIPDMLRQQAQEIEDLKNANRFIQNFAEEQHRRAVALEAEMEQLQDRLNEFLVARDLAILRKASEK